jgi:hypothetical protein
VASYRAAIASDPQHVLALCNLGLILGQDLGDLVGAARLFSAVLKIDPSHANAKSNLLTAQELME